MTTSRWQRFAILASVAWLVVGGLLASWNETWIAVWKLYCSMTGDPECTNATVFLVVHRSVIAGVLLFPLILAWLVAW